MKYVRLIDWLKIKVKVYIWIFSLKIKSRAKKKNKEVNIRFLRPVVLNNQLEFKNKFKIISLMLIKNLSSKYLLNLKIVRLNWKRNKFSYCANIVILKYFGATS
jgi:hypothetical protein